MDDDVIMALEALGAGAGTVAFAARASSRLDFNKRSSEDRLRTLDNGKVGSEASRIGAGGAAVLQLAGLQCALRSTCKSWRFGSCRIKH